jgi:hypothetical protein
MLYDSSNGIPLPAVPPPFVAAQVKLLTVATQQQVRAGTKARNVQHDYTAWRINGVMASFYKDAWFTRRHSATNSSVAKASTNEEIIPLVPKTNSAPCLFLEPHRYHPAEPATLAHLRNRSHESGRIASRAHEVAASHRQQVT